MTIYFLRDDHAHSRLLDAFVSLKQIQIMTETEGLAHRAIGNKTERPAAMPDVHSTHEFHQWYTELDARKKVEWDEKFRYLFVTRLRGCCASESSFVLHDCTDLIDVLLGVTLRC